MMVATYRSTCLAISKQHKLAVLLLFKRRAGLLLLIREFKFNARYAHWLKFVFQLEKNTANMLFSVALRILVLSGFAISAIAVPIPAGDPPSQSSQPITMAGHISALHAPPPLKPTGPEWPSLSAAAAAQQRKLPAQKKKQNPPVQQAPLRALIPTPEILSAHPELKNDWVRVKPLENGRGLTDAIKLEDKDGKVRIWSGQFLRGKDANRPSVTWYGPIQVDDLSEEPHFPLAGFWAQVNHLLEGGDNKIVVSDII